MCKLKFMPGVTAYVALCKACPGGKLSLDILPQPWISSPHEGARSQLVYLTPPPPVDGDNYLPAWKHIVRAFFFFVLPS